MFQYEILHSHLPISDFSEDGKEVPVQKAKDKDFEMHGEVEDEIIVEVSARIISIICNVLRNKNNTLLRIEKRHVEVINVNSIVLFE